MTVSRILVTDGHLRSSLAAVRSLGRAGHKVYVCSPRMRSLAGSSRYAIEEAYVPEPLSEPERFADAVKELLERWKISMLFPMSEESLLVLLPAGISGVTIPFAPLETFRRAANKTYVTTLAASIGIDVPEQLVIEAKPLDASQVDIGHLTFPIVVKPGRSVAGEQANRVKLGVKYAADRAALTARLDSLPAAAYPVLLQRRIEGPGTGVFLLMWNSRLLAQFAHRRIREKPPTGGVSVCAESIPADPETLARSRALLESLEWTGPAMVEFKQDRSSGRRYLMEINGRFWGSLQLAIDAGVDFPALLAASALGEMPGAVSDYEIGVRCRWWWGEVDHLIARLRGVSAGLGSGGRAHALREFLAPGAGVRNEILRGDDPRPFLRETMDWFRGR